MKPSTRSTYSQVSCRVIQLWLGILLASGSYSAFAAGEAKMLPDQHAHHVQEAKEAQKSNYKRSEHTYQVPEVKLVRQDGTEVALPKELDDGRAVFVNFMFTSCTSICPMLSHTFQQVQAKLGEGINKVHLVSISIDPEQDTPERLLAYAKRFKAGSAWDFYTGSAKSVVAVQKALDAYRGDKMNHGQIILMRSAPGKPWVRLDGFIDAATVVSEYKNQ